MPYKFSTKKVRLKEKHDKRCKLTKEQRIEIHKNEFGLSQRALARKYGVSRRLITFILDPAKKVRDLENRAARGGSKLYYDKDKHREAIKKHRRYKQKVVKDPNNGYKL